MSTTDNYRSNIAKYASSRCFTLSEAVEIQKEFDRQLWTGEQLNWVNCKTGKPITIGYS